MDDRSGTTPRHLLIVAPFAVALAVLAGCSNGQSAAANVQPTGPAAEWTAPSVVGMSMEDAEAAMSSARVPDTYVANLSDETSGLVVFSQKPMPGEVGKPDDRMTINVVPKSINDDTRDISTTLYPTAASGITYSITGSGTASVTYFDGAGQTAQDTEVNLPWSKTVDAAGGFAGGGIYVVQAQHLSGGGEISCEIKRDGVSVASNSSSGEYAIVSCDTH